MPCGTTLPLTDQFWYNDGCLICTKLAIVSEGIDTYVCGHLEYDNRLGC